MPVYVLRHEEELDEFKQDVKHEEHYFLVHPDSSLYFKPHKVYMSEDFFYGRMVRRFCS